MIEKLSKFVCVAHPKKKKSETRNNEGMGTFALPNTKK